MSEKIIKTRIINKHETEANWMLTTNFVPKQGELIIYDKDENYSYERFKIGDGATDVNSLPFAGADEIDALKSDLANKASTDYVDNKVAENDLRVEDDGAGNVTFESGAPTGMVIADVQQTTGQSTTAVMSQKAATDLFASKSDITDLQAALIGVSDLIGGDS